MKLICSICTIPNRSYMLKKVLESLLLQTLKPDLILIIVSKFYPRLNINYDQSELLELITFLNTFPLKHEMLILNTDLGPSMKLSIPLEYNMVSENDYILTLDDDCYLINSQIIETLYKYQQTFGNAIYGFVGSIQIGTNEKFIFSEHIKYCDYVSVDFIGGYRSVLYPISSFINFAEWNIVFLSEHKKENIMCCQSDILFSKFAKHKNIDQRVVRFDDFNIFQIVHGYGIHNDPIFLKSLEITKNVFNSYYFTPRTKKIFPLSYCIDLSLFTPLNNKKTQFFSNSLMINLYKNACINKTLYFKQYIDSFYCVAKINDKMHPLEIISNGCIPYYENITDCPSFLPKKLIHEIICLPGVSLGFIDMNIFPINKYVLLRHLIYNFTFDNLNGFSVTNNILKIIFPNWPTTHPKILFICGKNPKYLQFQILIGLKRLIGESNVIEIEKQDCIYIDDVKQSPLSNNILPCSFTYNSILELDPDIDRQENIISQNIIQHKYDLIIFGDIHDTFFSFFNLVIQCYKPNEIIYLCNENHKNENDFDQDGFSNIHPDSPVFIQHS